MGFSKEFKIENEDTLCNVKCPGCSNEFLIATIHTSQKFKCVKCGSEWYGRRAEEE